MQKKTGDQIAIGDVFQPFKANPGAGWYTVLEDEGTSLNRRCRLLKARREDGSETYLRIDPNGTIYVVR